MNPEGKIMKIFAPMTENDTSAKVSPRFARAKYFGIIDTETNDINIVDNDLANEAHGAGSRVINWCIKKGATAIIADQLGPNAQEVLDASPVKAYMSGGLGLDQIAVAYLNNELKEYNPDPNVPKGRRGGRGRQR